MLDLSTRELEGLERDVSYALRAGGHLLTSRSDRTLLAAPFDERRLRPAGPAVAVLREVAFGCNGAAALAVSDTGTLVYAKGYIRGSGADLARLVRVDEKGAVETLPFEAEPFGRVPVASPDGRFLAVVNTDGSLWIYDLVRQTRSRLPLGKTRAQGQSLIWSPDGRERRLLRNGRSGRGLEHLSPEGRTAAGRPRRSSRRARRSTRSPGRPTAQRSSTRSSARTRRSGRFRSTGRTPPRRIVAGQVTGASVSADGRWLAYEHQDSESWQTYVTADSGDGPQVPAVPRGRFPRFSPDGRSLYARRGDELVRVRVESGGRLDPSPPEALFKAVWRGYSVAPDGKGFFAVVDAGDSGIVRELHLVTNWFTELERLSPSAAMR